MRSLLLSLFASVLAAQTIEIGSLYQPAPLAGDWKEETGDSLQWSPPAFDDSQWTSVVMPRSSRPGAGGVTWYRIHVRLPEPLPAEPLFVLIGPLFPAYEIFANGKRIGQFGGPIGDVYGQLYARPATFPLPREANLVIAIRSEEFMLNYGGQSATAKESRSWIGTRAALAGQTAEWHWERQKRIEPLRLTTAILLAGSVFFIVLALWRGRNFEYSWIGLFLAGNAGYRIIQYLPEWFGEPNRAAAGLFASAAGIVECLGLFLFARTIFGYPPRWIARIGLAFTLLTDYDGVPFLAEWVRIHLSWFDRSNQLLYMAGEVAMYSDFAWQARHKLKDFWPVHAAFGIYVVSNLVFFGSTAAGVLTMGGDSLSGVEVVLRSATILVLFAMGIILSQRSARADQEQGRLQQEMAAAAEVQFLLLASASGGGTEASVDAVYVPASEVGGDFYHVQSYPDGAQIALVGDVSGKGLKAAMVVSVAIGALQNEPATTPEGILAGLNRALQGRVGSGFATCCCVRIEPCGRVTIASAGHPAPYCGGSEMEIEGGLPLGLTIGSDYSSREFQLRPGEQITLVSDGVLEAENRSGELFGFDRTREIAGESAQEIANAAKAWGQNDDITVVTVRRKA